MLKDVKINSFFPFLSLFPITFQASNMELSVKGKLDLNAVSTSKTLNKLYVLQF